MHPFIFLYENEYYSVASPYNLRLPANGFYTATQLASFWKNAQDLYFILLNLGFNLEQITFIIRR